MMSVPLRFTFGCPPVLGEIAELFFAGPVFRQRDQSLNQVRVDLDGDNVGVDLDK